MWLLRMHGKQLCQDVSGNGSWIQDIRQMPVSPVLLRNVRMCLPLRLPLIPALLCVLPCGPGLPPHRKLPPRARQRRSRQSDRLADSRPGRHSNHLLKGLLYRPPCRSRPHDRRKRRDRSRCIFSDQFLQFFVPYKFLVFLIHVHLTDLHT